MSILERQVHRAQFRLKTNQFLQHLALSITFAAIAWVLTIVADRLIPFGLPFWPSIGAAAALALAIAVTASAIRRIPSLTAAIALDRAAGLKERVSTGLSFQRAADPFARAAVQDAEKIAAGVTVSAHVPYRAPQNWPAPAGALVVAVLLAAFLPQFNLLAKDTQATPEQRQALEREQANIKIAIKDQMDKVKQLAEGNPQLKDAIKDIAPMELPKSPTTTPDDIRREAVKQIDKVSEKLADQKNSDKEDTLKQLKRMMAQIDAKQDLAPNDKLASSLSSGDFSGAKQALEEMKKQLEDAAKTGDPEAKKKMAEMQQKLDSIAKQLNQAANGQQLQKELESKAGLSSEEAKEMLKQLSKMDPKQLEKELQKRLAEKGMSKEQIEKLAQKLANNKDAMKAAQKMADAMQKASQCMKQGQDGQQGKQGKQGQQGQQGKEGQQGQGEAEAAQAMADAAEQLSELEMSEQQLDDVQQRLAELENLKEDIGQGNCNGKGDPGDRVGNQGGNAGLGEGSRIGKEKLAHDFKMEKAKTKLKGGKIIGQSLVDGEQIRGEAQAEVLEAVNSAVRDATDAVNRDEVPRQYEKTLQTYFDRLSGLSKDKSPAEGKPADATPDAEEPKESADGD